MRLPVAATLLAMLSACSLAGPGNSQPDARIVATADGAALTRAALVSRLATADIVVLGEVHDNPAHHLAQAHVVGALAPSGIAFEMIPEASEEGIDAFLAQGGAPGDIGPAIGWEKLGWPDWAIYRPIFEAASPDVYFAGGAVSRAVLRRAASGGREAWLLAPPIFQPVLTEPLPPAQQAAMEAEMIDAHCGHLPASAAPAMVESQRLRDASFAAAALRAQMRTGGRVVLITGNGHARTNVGVPHYIKAIKPGLEVLSVGLLEAEPADPAAEPYDFIWVTEPHPRDDPCAQFR